MSQWDPSPGANPYGSPGSFSDATAEKTEISPQAVELIRQSRPWAILAGIVSIFMGLLMGLGSIGAAATEPVGPLENKDLRMLLVVVYAVLAVVGIVGGVSALRYGSRSARLVRNVTPENLEIVLRSIRNIWRFVGLAAAILTVMFIVQVINGFLAAMRLQESLNQP